MHLMNDGTMNGETDKIEDELQDKWWMAVWINMRNVGCITKLMVNGYDELMNNKNKWKNERWYIHGCIYRGKEKWKWGEGWMINW